MRTLLPVLLLGLVGGCAQEAAWPPTLPLADAGNDQVRALGDDSAVTVALDGRGSCHPDEKRVSHYAWSFLASPGAEPTLRDASLAQADFDAAQVGRYVLRLVVRADGEESEPDIVTVDVIESGDDVIPPAPIENRCGLPFGE